MPLVKIWKHDRSVKKITMITSLEEIIDYGHNVLGYDKNFKLRVVYESDGTEIETNSVFQYLIDDGAFPGTILMLLPEGYIWMAVDCNPLSTLQTSNPLPSLTTNTVETMDSTESFSTALSYSFLGNHNTELDKFTIPWGKLSAQFLRDCENGTKPSLEVRREAIRQIVACIRKVSAHPPRKFIENIAREIVSKYPKSLGDAAGSKRYEHFFEQLENRMYHLNRCTKSNSRSLFRKDDGTEK